jgi:hypothetical protein
MGGFAFERWLSRFRTAPEILQTLGANFWRVDMTRTRGRPPTTQSYEFSQGLWVRIESLRIRLAKPNGRPASIRYVAIALAKNGGVAEIVGGNQEALALEVALLPNTRLAHATVEMGEMKLSIPVYATYLTSEATRIRNLYYKACQWTADPEIKFAWTNMVRDLCGQPRKLRKSSMQFHRADCS